MSVYKAINAVQAELSVNGITKDRTNTQGSGYKFRGIDDVYNTIAPMLAPASFAPDGSALVKTIVTIKGKAKSCWLPVMNHRNQAIKNPDAFNINTAIVRCLTKCISMHGLGLYIYAGEDLPEEDVPLSQKEVKRMGGLSNIGDDLSQDWKTYLEDTAKLVSDLVSQGKFDEANFERYKEPLDDVQELYLERFLDSKTRSAIRKHNATKAA